MPEDSSVKRLKKKLYRRGGTPKPRARRELHEIEHEALPADWEEKKEGEDKDKKEDPKKVLENLYEGHLPGDEYTKEPDILHDERFTKGYDKAREDSRVTARIIKTIFIGSFIFFLCAAGFAFIYIFKGVNQVTCDNVDIMIEGPMSIASGKKFSLDVNVANHNPVSMQDTELEIIFPSGTKDGNYPSTNLPSSKREIGTINSEERPVVTTVDAIMFGEVNAEKEVKAIVTYGIDDSDATFTCENTYRMTVATAPITVTVDGLEEISSGQELELTIGITSNSEELVPNLRLIVDYPFGYEFISSEPKPILEDNIWDIGDVPPGTERILKIKGVFRGQGTESRAIKIEVGEMDPVDDYNLATTLHKVSHHVLVTKPFLALDLTFNDNSEPQVIAQLGKSVRGDLEWSNTTNDALHDLSIECAIDGSMLDKTSVQVSTGFFRSIDNTIMWTPQTTKEKFRIIEPGERGQLQFFFETKEFDSRTSARNPTMSVSCDVEARRISDNIPVPQSLHDQAQKTILFDSSLVFDAYAVYSIGSFTNTGPHPPKVDKETTYTVVWLLSNTTNDVHSVTAKGTLPDNVTWPDNYSPVDEKVSFNSVTREVIWHIDDMPRAVGYETPVKKLEFQVSTIPSVSQLKDSLVLIQDMNVQGVDNFTGNVIERTERNVTTWLQNDPYFKNSYGQVEN